MAADAARRGQGRGHPLLTSGPAEIQARSEIDGRRNRIWLIFPQAPTRKPPLLNFKRGGLLYSAALKCCLSAAQNFVSSQKVPKVTWCSWSTSSRGTRAATRV